MTGVLDAVLQLEPRGREIGFPYNTSIKTDRRNPNECYGFISTAVKSKTQNYQRIKTSAGLADEKLMKISFYKSDGMKLLK